MVTLVSLDPSFGVWNLPETIRTWLNAMHGTGGDRGPAGPPSWPQLTLCLAGPIAQYGMWAMRGRPDKEAIDVLAEWLFSYGGQLAYRPASAAEEEGVPLTVRHLNASPFGARAVPSGRSTPLSISSWRMRRCTGCMPWRMPWCPPIGRRRLSLCTARSSTSSQR
jgi:hypothetical protein